MQSCRIYWKRIRVWILVFARNFIVVLNFKRKKHTKKLGKWFFENCLFFCKTVFKIIKLLKIVFHFTLLVCTIQSKFNKNPESLPTIEITCLLNFGDLYSLQSNVPSLPEILKPTLFLWSTWNYAIKICFFL